MHRQRRRRAADTIGSHCCAVPCGLFLVKHLVRKDWPIHRVRCVPSFSVSLSADSDSCTSIESGICDLVAIKVHFNAHIPIPLPGDLLVLRSGLHNNNIVLFRKFTALYSHHEQSSLSVCRSVWAQSMQRRRWDLSLTTCNYYNSGCNNNWLGSGWVVFSMLISADCCWAIPVNQLWWMLYVVYGM